MKKLILLSSLIGSATLYAQNIWFIQATLGTGVTATSTVLGDYNNIKDGPRSAAAAQLLLGYRHQDLIFRAGLAYLQAGHTGYVDQDPSNEYLTNQYQVNNYLAIPLSIGYNIQLGPRLSIVPAIGYSLGFMTSTTRSVLYQPEISLFSSYRLPSVTYMETRSASGINSFASVQIELDYKLNSKLSITAGPQGQFNFSQEIPNNTDFFRPYTYTFNVGLKYAFSHKHSEIRSAQ